MDIKIQPGGGPSPIGDTADIKEAATVAADASTAGDPVTQVAVDLLEGRITSEQAVDRLIAQTMDMPMIGAAPEELRGEIEQILRMALETDPYLRSLAADLSG